MFGKWMAGSWRNKNAHWLAVNVYLKVVVRATEFNPDAALWQVFAVFGNYEDTLADKQGHPIRFPMADVEAAKAAAIAHAVKTTGELFEAVKELTAASRVSQDLMREIEHRLDRQIERS